MKIRTVDEKNRVTITADGKLYSESVDENGVITLYPINVPKPPTAPGDDALRAIYVSRMPQYGALPTTITLHVNLGAGLLDAAKSIAEMADRFEVPVVIIQGGMNNALIDSIRDRTEQDVIEVKSL